MADPGGEIDVHPSAARESLAAARSAVLRSNQIEPRWLYLTARQAELWREVARRHAPIQRDPAFRRLYENAFAEAAARATSRAELALIGLGCGTGEKEAQLHAHLRREGRPVYFSALDASRELVEEAASRLAASGAILRRSLVCDLAQAGAWRDWLEIQHGATPRMVTFFGLVPNFAPSQLGDLWRAALRPGDTLLASVHLAPSGKLEPILPQYDNPETRAWLEAGLAALELDSLVERPVFTTDEVEGIPAVIASAKWRRPEESDGAPSSASPRKASLRLFASLRYTPELFEGLARREGFAAECLALTPCRQEGIWQIRRG